MAAFFRSLVIGAGQADQHPDAIRRMRQGDFEGIVLRDVYGPAECEQLCSRLESGAHGLLRTDFPPVMRAFFYGINLNLAPPDLSGYFREAPRFKQSLRRLFSDSIDLEARLSGLLSQLDGARPYLAAPGPAPGVDHMFTTIRAHLRGGFIPPHFDNEQAYRQSYRLVMSQIDGDLFSFVLAFSTPEADGELEIFNLQHEGRAFRMADGDDDASHLDLQGVESIRFRLRPGEMIIFNSGRYLHRVNRVAGNSTRWTACSFMSESLSRKQVYCWG